MPPRSSGNKTHTEQIIREPRKITLFLNTLYFYIFVFLKDSHMSYSIYSSPQAYKNRYGYYFLLN